MAFYVLCSEHNKLFSVFCGEIHSRLPVCEIYGMATYCISILCNQQGEVGCVLLYLTHGLLKLGYGVLEAFLRVKCKHFV